MAVVLIVLFATTSLFAQTNAPAPPTQSATIDGGEPTYLTPETPEKRKARIGTAEDPGPNPDPNAHFWRYGKSYHIERFLRASAVYTDKTNCPDPGWIRPYFGVNACMEVYQHNDKYVWVWMPDPDPAAAAAVNPVPDEPAKQAASSRYSAEAVSFLEKFRSEFTEVMPASTDVTLTFEESSEGLPQSGSWRNSAAFADMNGDGHIDIITPPQRGRDTKDPKIFLGDGKGKWRSWPVTWPYPLDYGNVVAADFNKDGRPDLAFGVHLKGVYVFMNNGDSTFSDSPQGLPRDFPTRRVAATDVDRDGAIDVIALSEGPTVLQTEATNHGRILVLFNRKKATVWEPFNLAEPRRAVGGDFLSIGNFNGDRYPDFVASSIFLGSPDTVWLSKNSKEWVSAATPDGLTVPPLSYYHASAVGKFTSGSAVDSAILSYTRFWPTDVDAKLVPKPESENVTGLDFLTFTKTGVKRRPIMRWGGNNPIWGMASADFNSDGKLDVMLTRFAPRDAVLLLGDGKGGFARGQLKGFAPMKNTNYDLQVTDVNKDGLPDLVLLYETGSGTDAMAARDGSVQVYLNRGVQRATATAGR